MVLYRNRDDSEAIEGLVYVVDQMLRNTVVEVMFTDVAVEVIGICVKWRGQACHMGR